MQQQSVGMLRREKEIIRRSKNKKKKYFFVLRERVCVSGRWLLIAGDVDSRLFSWNAKQVWRVGHGHFRHLHQGTLIHGEVSLYGWSPVCFVCIQLICLCWITTVLLVLSNPNQLNRRSAVQWYFPLSWVFSDLWINLSLDQPVYPYLYQYPLKSPFIRADPVEILV